MLIKLNHRCIFVQMIKISKNKNLISYFFILAYASFLLIYTLHFHHYNLNEQIGYKVQQKENAALILDFLSDGLNICAVCHFSHSILNYCSISDVVNLYFQSIEKVIFKPNSCKYLTNLLTNLSPRASPLSS